MIEHLFNSSAFLAGFGFGLGLGIIVGGLMFVFIYNQIIKSIEQGRS